jgi:transcription-repair coupling factor (superfamily II helicase)
MVVIRWICLLLCLRLFISIKSKKSTTISSPPKPKIMPLIIDPNEARIRIAGQRFIIPGDYVVSEEYGVGMYIGIKIVDITPTRLTRTFEPTVIIRFEDGEISWFQRIVDKDLWLYRTGDSGEHILSTLIDRKKWKKRKSNAEEGSKSLAINLIRMMAIRNSFHRTPCLKAENKYSQFEQNFAFEPTEDQRKCFTAIERDMVNNTRPMDRLVCGDVGFGKTEVAMRAIYRAVLSNKQVALLAPTRVLALQHLRVLKNRMPDVEVRQLQ